MHPTITSPNFSTLDGALLQGASTSLQPPLFSSPVATIYSHERLAPKDSKCSCRIASLDIRAFLLEH